MKILIATDGSRFSKAAIAQAGELAKSKEGLSFKVVSVYEPQVPTAAEPYAISAEYYQRLDEFAQKRAAEAAQEGADLIRKHIPAAQIETFVELGIPGQVIVEQAETWGADLVVMGSHGYGFWGRLAIGSVSDAVLHHAPCSVLVVKSPAEETTN